METYGRRHVFNKPQPDPGLESVIADCERELRDDLDPASKEYKETLARYKDLQALRVANRQPTGLDPNTLVLAAANLLGIVIIVAYEQKQLLNSKAVGFLKKLI